MLVLLVAVGGSALGNLVRGNFTTSVGFVHESCQIAVHFLMNYTRQKMK